MRRIAISGVLLSLLVLPVLEAQHLSSTGVYTSSEGKECPMAGSATSTRQKALNRLKNRFTFPDNTDIDPNVTLAAMLAPGDDTDRFDTQEAARITGLVIDVKRGGKEDCNCKASNAIDRDTHIELALHKDAPKTQRAIVEVTPRVRLLKNGTGTDWSTETLEKTTEGGIKGKWVEVTGWLLFDEMHRKQAENTNPGHAGNWRATCWELHPVTDIKILTGPPEGTPEVHPSILAAFHRAHVQHVKRDPKRRAAIAKAIADRLAEFDPEELKESEEEAKERLKD